MTETILTQVLNILLTAIATWLAAAYRNRKKQDRAVREGLQCLLRDRIIQGYNHYVDEKGWIPIWAKDSLDACYASYENLGSNGTINGLMEQINALPNYDKGAHE